MKILATILFTFFSLTCFSQEVEVKSEELNRIIWNKINDRLIGRPFMIDQFKMVIKLKKQ